MTTKKKNTTDLQGESVATKPGSAKKMIRKRTELSIMFRLRSGQTTGDKKRQLQIRLTVGHKGVDTPRAESDYGSGIMVRPSQWDSKAQQVRGRSADISEINERIVQTELDIREIWRLLKRKHAEGFGQPPTGILLKLEHQNPGTADPLLLDFFQVFLDYKDSLYGTEDGQAEKTTSRYYKSKVHVMDFLSYEEKRPAGQQPTLRLSQLTTGHAKRFHAWLQVDPKTGARRMLKDSANKHLSVLRDCLEYALDNELLSKNPLDRFRPKRGKTKPVVFLNAAQVLQLEEFETVDEQLSNVLWWTRLMCYTGLDYADAIRYARRRYKFETDETGGNGKKIVIDRSKPPFNTCEIPLSTKTDMLFFQHPEGPHAPVLADINRHLKVIGPVIGFEPKFTSKICRKTAGAIWMREGYSVAGVSRFLGHSSTRVTEQHYVKINSDYVNREIERVNNLTSFKLNE